MRFHRLRTPFRRCFTCLLGASTIAGCDDVLNDEGTKTGEGLCRFGQTRSVLQTSAPIYSRSKARRCFADLGLCWAMAIE